MEKNKNCLFVNVTGIMPFNRCKYCERRARECFGMQFLFIGTIIIGLLALTLSVTDLPAIALDLVLVITFLVAILTYLAFSETNEIALNRAMLEKLNKELEESVRQRTLELERSNKELIAVNQMKNDFLGIINHELKTPITAVLSGIDVIRAHGLEKFDDSQRKILELMATSGEDMLKLTNNLLDLSKIESGKFEVFPEYFPLINLLEEVIQDLKPAAEKKKVQFKTSIDNAITTIYADSVRLKQVIFNLIDNAIKYSKENGTIIIHASSLNEHIELEIKDNGLGIKEENLDKIFDKFARRVPGYKGTGLGLYISKSFIEAHKGSIDVRSKYGEGATFRIVLPKVRPT